MFPERCFPYILFISFRLTNPSLEGLGGDENEGECQKPEKVRGQGFGLEAYTFQKMG